MAWTPIAKNELEEIIDKQLSECFPEFIEIFNKYIIPLQLSPIVRYKRLEAVFIVARNQNGVLYYEDVEEGFNFSPINEDGMILEHWCNQDSLRIAIHKWFTDK